MFKILLIRNALNCNSIFSSYGSFQIICQQLRNLAVSQSLHPKADARMARDAAYAVDSPEELIEVLNQVAVDVHGFYVLRSSPDHPEHDALRSKHTLPLSKIVPSEI